MKKTPEHIIELFTAFKDGMLPALSKGNTHAFDCLKRAHIEIGENNCLPLEIKLGKLFTAVQLWGIESGVQYPSDIDNNRDFEAFENHMFNSGALDNHEKSGVTIRPIKSKVSKVNRVYKLSYT